MLACGYLEHGLEHDMGSVTFHRVKYSYVQTTTIGNAADAFRSLTNERQNKFMFRRVNNITVN